MGINDYPILDSDFGGGGEAIRWHGTCGTCGASMEFVEEGLYKCPKCESTTTTRLREMICGHDSKWTVREIGLLQDKNLHNFEVWPKKYSKRLRKG